MDKEQEISKKNFAFQRNVAIIGVILFIGKLIAWQLTNSDAIFSDAMESIVNIIAAFMGLYALYLASKPRDEDHPYGHGKVEFISAAFEGLLISIAGLIIIYEAINNFIHPHALKQLDYGLILLGITSVVNYIVGYFCVRKGLKENSPILIASGSHLKSDTYSTLGLLVGIGLIMITGFAWLDSITAILFAFLIIYTGYKIIRKSLSGIMDEYDLAIINDITEVLNQHRQSNWIDIHNMRVINYAGDYHIDCHLTVPFYITVNDAHIILDSLTDLLKKHFEERVEFFIHIDGCLPNQCTLCNVANCNERKSNFIKQITWTHENILSNKKHILSNEK